jgi:hypothetical protein
MANQGPGKVVIRVRLEVIGVDPPLLAAAGAGMTVQKIIEVPTPC